MPTRGTVLAICLGLSLATISAARETGRRSGRVGETPESTAESVSADGTSKNQPAEIGSSTWPVTSVAVERRVEGIPTVNPLAPLIVLYDQTTAVNLNASSQNFEPFNDVYDNQAADDFVVTGTGWNVTTVFAPGEYSATHGSPQSMRVAFYADAGGSPGAILCDFPTQPFVEAPVGSFTIGIPGCALTPGTKWVSVVANLSLGPGGQWFWNTRTILTGNPSKWQNPGGGFNTPCATWGTRTTCLGQTDPDMAFRLEGTKFCNSNPDCVDANLCNGVETCVASACEPGTPVNCDDGLLCTLDTCNIATGACAHAPNTCSDGSACTVDNCDETLGCLNDNQCLRFCNNTGPTIVDGTRPPTLAAPYPSQVAVSGFTLPAMLASVEFRISHTFPDDVDVLLVGPGGPGQNAIIMSDVGGGADVLNLDLSLSDSGAAALPDAGPLVTGTFRPANFTSAPADAWPAPAPVPAGGSALSVFTGTNPNGLWSLYIVDDENGDAGAVGFWCVSLRSICAFASDCNDGNPCTTDTCSATGVCNRLPNTNACDDGDPCTVSDACFAGTCTPGTPAPGPPEVTGLSAAADKVTYNWSAAPPATDYDVLRAAIAALPVGPGGGDETCFQNVGGTTLVDGAVPAGGSGYAYLARGEWVCGVGPYGSQSNGTPRVSTTCP